MNPKNPLTGFPAEGMNTIFKKIRLKSSKWDFSRDFLRDLDDLTWVRNTSSKFREEFPSVFFKE